MAEAFHDAGYATHYIGKWHMDGDPKPGFVPPGWRRRGFETFEGFNRGHYYPKGAQYFTNDGKLLKPGQVRIRLPDRPGDRLHEAAAGQAVLLLPVVGPAAHAVPAAGRVRSVLEDAEAPVAAERAGEAPRHADACTRKWPATSACARCSTTRWPGCSRRSPTWALADNTLVVFSADHGDMHGSHGLYRKGKPQEESLHIPLFMRLPSKIKPGQTPATLASSIDLMPTIHRYAACRRRRLAPAATCRPRCWAARHRRSIRCTLKGR